MKMTIREQVFTALPLIGGWYHWCIEDDHRFQWSQMVVSKAGATYTPPWWRRGPDDWDQYVVIAIESSARQIYPTFEASTRGLRRSVRLGRPIDMPASRRTLLRFGVGHEPCRFGAAIRSMEGAWCTASIDIEYKMFRFPGGPILYADIGRDTDSEIAPPFDYHV